MSTDVEKRWVRVAELAAYDGDDATFDLALSALRRDPVDEPGWVVVVLDSYSQLPKSIYGRFPSEAEADEYMQHFSDEFSFVAPLYFPSLPKEQPIV